MGRESDGPADAGSAQADTPADAHARADVSAAADDHQPQVSSAPPWAVPGVSPQASPIPHASARLVDESVRLTEQFAQDALSTDAGQQLVLARRLIDQLEALWLVAASDFDRGHNAELML